MTVIADTSPLQYAVEIDVAHTLFMLYGRIVVPVAVSSEMRHPGAPLLLRRWVEDSRARIEVRSVQDFRLSPEFEAWVRTQYGEKAR